MQANSKLAGFRVAQRSLISFLVVGLLMAAGCQRLGTAVSKYLPEKTKKVAAKEAASEPAETSADAGQPDSSPMQNMGGGALGGSIDSFPENDPEDDLQNLGDPSGRAFDPANDDTLEAGAEAGAEVDPLTGDGTDQLQDPESLLGEYSGGSVADPAGAPQGDPGLGTAGSFGPPTNQPSGRPPAGSQSNQPSRNRKPAANRKSSGASKRNNNTNPNTARVEEPEGKPLMRLTANAVAPVQTREGQRVGFSLEYQLQRSGLSGNGEYGLMIESAKNGRVGVAVKLTDEGTLQIAAVPQFRPTSGPFKAFLVQRTKTGMQRISNVVQFKTLY